jgi:hypothetical protein
MRDAAVEVCIEEQELLCNAGLLHRDLSINNFVVDKKDSNPLWRAFSIDLYLAVGKQPKGASGAKGKTVFPRVPVLGTGR